MGPEQKAVTEGQTSVCTHQEGVPAAVPAAARMVEHIAGLAASWKRRWRVAPQDTLRAERGTRDL